MFLENKLRTHQYLKYQADITLNLLSGLELMGLFVSVVCRFECD